MDKAADIAKIKEQELGLVFDKFDEATAFSIGCRVRDRAIREGLAVVVEVRLWDRLLFYCAMPGTTGDNSSWVRRKFNVVQRLLRSSYRCALEQSREDRTFPASIALDPADFVLAGGGFPIRLKGLGPIGCATVSGLPEREDHQVVVDAICDELGLDKAAFALAK